MGQGLFGFEKEKNKKISFILIMFSWHLKITD